MTQFLRRAALIAAAVLALPSAACAQRDQGSRLDTTFAFAKGGSVELRIFSGDIIVTGWTRQEVKISAKVERGSIESSFSSGRVSLATRSDRGRSGEAHFEVMVPIGTQVQTSSISGDTRVKGTAGEVQVNSTSGDVEVIDAVNHIIVQSISGSVRAEKLRGRARIETTSGDLEFDDVIGELSAHTISGEVTMHRMQLTQLTAETTSGEITYSGSIDSKGSYELTAHSGDVKFEIPASSSARLDLQTFSGSISSAFPITLQPGQTPLSRRGKKMQFTLGGGGARVAIETFSGDIIIGRTTFSPNKEN
jgi:DUF4097 and DUF4098 domain-containing protein YvlB